MKARDQIRRRQIEREAEGFLELGMPEHALAALARSKNPARLTTHGLYLQGEALRSLERYAEALRPLEQAAKIATEDIHLRLAMAWCYKRTGRIDLAIRAMEAAIEHEPTEPLLQYNLACYLSLVGAKRRALAHLSQALAIDPDYRTLIDDEPDFDPIRSDPDFQALTSMIV